jgi:mannosyltransferase OCH1-like enzyme
MYYKNLCTRKKTFERVKKYGDISTKKWKCIKKKRVIHSIIPLHIYQVWHDDNLPSSVLESVNWIKEQNPEFTHHLYNEKMCRQFIKDNFREEVLHTYDTLIPYALKFDLWRYCVIYKNGGIYLDSKIYGINGFKFIHLTDSEYFCKDTTFYGIYNAILICKPNNEILLQCINKVIENVKNRFYGTTGVCPTGPLMMLDFFTKSQHEKLKLELEIVPSRKRYVRFNGCRILTTHDKYSSQKKNKWLDQWFNRNIYN